MYFLLCIFFEQDLAIFQIPAVKTLKSFIYIEARLVSCLSKSHFVVLPGLEPSSLILLFYYKET